jgi:WD40 repeat protein
MNRRLAVSLTSFLLTASAVGSERAKPTFSEERFRGIEVVTKLDSPDTVIFSPDSKSLDVVHHRKLSSLALNWSQQIEVVRLSDAKKNSNLIEMGKIDDKAIAVWMRNGLSYSKDGTRLLTLRPRRDPGGGKLTILDALSKTTLQTLQYDFKSPIQAFAFSPSSEYVAACGYRIETVTHAPNVSELKSAHGTMRIWQVKSGEERLHEDWDDGVFSSLSFSPDGELLAVGGGKGQGDYESGEVRLLDVNDAKPIWARQAHAARVLALAFSPDGKWLVSSGRDCALIWWNASTGQQVDSTSLKKQSRPWGVDNLAFSPDGSILAVAMGNWNRGQQAGELRLIDVKSKRTIEVLLKQHPKPVVSVSFSPDGTKLAACTFNGVKLWHVGPN